MKQISLFDICLSALAPEGDPDIVMEKHMNAPEPLCYSCEHAIKRGPFRLCRIGRKGHKKLGRWNDCKKYCPPQT